ADFSEAVFRRTGIETVLWDERLTSEEAANLLRMNGIEAENEKEYIDMVAAKVILESYLEHCREEEN
ncbi:MAG: Holliday junction resolvase RuvX, partial [Butyrivibrio sp.]|nr:Holliday junction resolvase RuvX [Butyrivibrio sp.]